MSMQVCVDVYIVVSVWVCECVNLIELHHTEQQQAHCVVVQPRIPHSHVVIVYIPYILGNFLSP